ncbi:MAG: hypothetical protein HZB33_01645 [Nitrospirae bacterium]|nr:hypothetical protein [Nitrospirota bacterium]
MHLKTFPAAFMLGLFFLMSVVGSEGTLLCFGKDGHVAIELVDACNGAGLGSQLAESDACGPCKDVRFLGGPANTGNTSHNTRTLSLIYSSPVLSSLPQQEYCNNPLILPVYSHHKALAGLQSVVLLI